MNEASILSFRHSGAGGSSPEKKEESHSSVGMKIVPPGAIKSGGKGKNGHTSKGRRV